MGLLDMFYARGSELKLVSPPVGVNPTMIRDTPTTLVLRESMFSISGDDYSVTDVNTNKAVCKVQGKMFSLHDRKKIVDADGNLLFNLADRIVANERTFLGKNHNGDVLKVWRPRGWTLGSKLAANFKSVDGRWADLELSGDMWGGTANLILDGTKLAHISREMMNANEVIADQQTYYLTVAPGVDVGLMVAVCICFDEVKNEAENEPKQDE